MLYFEHSHLIASEMSSGCTFPEGSLEKRVGE